MDTAAVVTSDFPVLRREQMWNAMQRLVLNGLSSPHTRRAYSQALGVFVIWFCSEPGRLLTKAVVQEYRVVLERKGLTLARTDLASRLAGRGASDHTNRVGRPTIHPATARIRGILAVPARNGLELDAVGPWQGDRVDFADSVCEIGGGVDSAGSVCGLGHSGAAGSSPDAWCGIPLDQAGA